jgi:hypothetical protein
MYKKALNTNEIFKRLKSTLNSGKNPDDIIRSMFKRTATRQSLQNKLKQQGNEESLFTASNLTEYSREALDRFLQHLKDMKGM